MDRKDLRVDTYWTGQRWQMRVTDTRTGRVTTREGATEKERRTALDEVEREWDESHRESGPPTLSGITHASIVGGTADANAVPV